MRDTIGRKPFHSSKGIKKKREIHKSSYPLCGLKNMELWVVHIIKIPHKEQVVSILK